MKKNTLFCLFLTLLLPFVARTQSNDYYIQLEDASGFNTAPYQDSLEAHAYALVQALPDTFRNLFRVYDFGFYQHHEVTSGYPDAFEKKKAEVAALTPYYLLFGKQTDKTGVYTKIWVDLKLPEGGCFDDLSTTYREMFLIGLIKFADFEYNAINKNYLLYNEVENLVIDSISKYTAKIVDCCNTSNKSAASCTECPDDQEIYTWLISNGFIGFPCNVVNTPNLVNYPNIENYSSVSVLNSDIFFKLNSIISYLPSSSSGTPKGYVTDKSSICYSSAFEGVQNNYLLNKNDHDVWVHIWTNSSGESYIFVRSEQYIFADDEDLLNDLPVTLKSNEVDNQSGDYWLLVDPSKGKFYLSDAPMPLPNYSYEPDPLLGEYFHTVEDGESFSSIAEATNGAFTALQLATWNNLTLNSVIHPGDKLKLFVNEIMLQTFIDGLAYPLSIPLKKASEIGTYKFITTESKLKVFSSENPDLKLGENPPALLKIGEPMLGYGGGFYSPPPGVSIEVNPINEPLTVTENAPMERKPWTSAAPWLMRAGFTLGFILFDAQSFGTSDIPLHMLAIKERLEEDENVRVQFKPLIETSPTREPRDGEFGYYVTYTKRQTGQIHTESQFPLGVDISMYTTKTYVGRSRGYNRPKQIVKLRNSRHERNIDPGMEKHGCLDKATRITTSKVEIQALRHADPGYQVMRGREQNIMDDVGKAWSQIDRNNIKRTRSANKINGIKKAHPYFVLWTNTAEILWGRVPFSYEVFCTP